jgi:mono/diheme cytochrome c family protein
MRRVGWRGAAVAAYLGAAVAAGPVAGDEIVETTEAGITDPAQIGRIEYMTACAQCHGIDGQGDGVIAGYLTVDVPDLTAIQRENDGIFPAGVLFEIIEGGGGTSAHGTREMPAWGDRYSAEAYAVLGWPHEPEEREAFVRGRILALVEYVAGMQRD